MKRYALALVLAASVAAPAVPAFADHCGDDTLQPPCQTCVVDSIGREIVCVPVDVHHV